jgi:dihydroorotate dehydrogenase electron transfer subunit
MMKAVAAYASQHHIHCEVSLENLMACGIGVCLCCVVNTINGNVCSCTDGPVFNINMLKW